MSTQTARTLTFEVIKLAIQALPSKLQNSLLDTPNNKQLLAKLTEFCLTVNQLPRLQFNDSNKTT